MNPSLLERIYSNVRFCQRCAAPVERRELFGSSRPVCPRCGWVFYADPKVAAGVLVEDERGVLLVQRLNEPGRGQWTIPGGFMDAGEDPAEAARRECLEETGLVVEITDLLDVIPGREHDNGADMVIVYLARVTGGALQAADDAGQAAYFPRGSLPPIAFRATEVALARVTQ